MDLGYKNLIRTQENGQDDTQENQVITFQRTVTVKAAVEENALYEAPDLYLEWGQEDYDLTEGIIYDKEILGWGYNPSENVWKSVDYPVGGDYGFTVGGQGYAMSPGNGEGTFEAYTFRVVN